MLKRVAPPPGRVKASSPTWPAVPGSGVGVPLRPYQSNNVGEQEGRGKGGALYMPAQTKERRARGRRLDNGEPLDSGAFRVVCCTCAGALSSGAVAAAVHERQEPSTQIPKPRSPPDLLSYHPIPSQSIPVLSHPIPIHLKDPLEPSPKPRLGGTRAGPSLPLSLTGRLRPTAGCPPQARRPPRPTAPHRPIPPGTLLREGGAARRTG